MTLIERIHKFENLHIVFWLCKDISWCMEWKTFGVIMITPTVALALAITFMTRHTRKEKYHNSAVCFWIAANSLWMLGEFYDYANFRGNAQYLFFAGMACIVWYYVSDFIINNKEEKAAN